MIEPDHPPTAHHPPTDHPGLRLFDPDRQPDTPDEESLRWLFDAHYLERLQERSVNDKTVAEYLATINLWEGYSNTSVSMITDKRIAKFSGWLAALPGRGRREYMAPATRDKHLRNLLALLKFAKSRGLTTQRLEFRLPKKVVRAPAGAVTIDQVAAWTMALERLQYPDSRLIGQPRKWWARGVMFVLFYTGLRPCAGLRLRYSDLGAVDARGGRPLWIRDEINKGDLEYWHYLHPEAVRAISRMRVTGDYLFASEWPKLASPGSQHDNARMTLGRAMVRAAKLAGVELPAGNVFKVLRKSHATILGSINEMAVTVSLGHKTRSVALEHYVENSPLLIDAILKMPSLADAMERVTLAKLRGES